MEEAGVLPPVEKFGRAPKAARPAGASVKDEVEVESDGDKDSESADSDIPLLLEDDETLESLGDDGSDREGPPEVDPAV